MWAICLSVLVFVEVPSLEVKLMMKSKVVWTAGVDTAKCTVVANMVRQADNGYVNYR